MRINENLLPKSNQLQIPQIALGSATQSAIVDGVLHVWNQSQHITNMIPYVSVGLDPSKTYCLGFFGEIVSGQYSIHGLLQEYRNVRSDNGTCYIKASGATKLTRIHLQTQSVGGGEVYIKSFFLVEGDKPPSIWTPAHADLTPEQIATLPPYGEYKEILPL